MESAQGYHRDEYTVPFGERTIVVESWTPVFSPPAWEAAKREVERGLYDILGRCADKRPPDGRE